MTIKTVLIEGVGWPEAGELPARLKHDHVKPVRKFKHGREKAKATDANFEAWLSKPQPVKTMRSK